MSDERPKRSWRDIDRGRDKSAHRSDPRPDGPSGPRQKRSQTSYRAALDRAFDIGALGKLLGTEPRVDGQSQNRAKQLAEIRDAATPEEVTGAVDRALADGPLPDEIEIWARVVDHRDMKHVREALSRLALLLDTHPLKRTRALRARLRYLEEIAEDDDIRRDAAALRSRLPA